MRRTVRRIATAMLATPLPLLSADARAQSSARSAPCARGAVVCPDSLFPVVVPSAISVGARPGSGPQVTITVRVFNAARRPVVLELQRQFQQHASLGDNARNIYSVPGEGAVHGIGLFRGAVVDPEFTVPPGETRDFSIDFVPRDPKRAPGSRFDFTIDLVPMLDAPDSRPRPSPGSVSGSVRGVAPGAEVQAYATRMIGAIRDARATCGNDVQCIGTALTSPPNGPTLVAETNTQTVGSVRSPASRRGTAGDSRGGTTASSTLTATNTMRTARGTAPASAPDTAGAVGDQTAVGVGTSVLALPGMTLNVVGGSARAALGEVGNNATDMVTSVADSAATGAANAAKAKVDIAKTKVNSTLGRMGDAAKKRLGGAFGHP